MESNSQLDENQLVDPDEAVELILEIEEFIEAIKDGKMEGEYHEF